jgi:hypothetical protein
MLNGNDLPADLMQSLKARSCDRATYDAHLEERIMQEFAKRKQKSRRGLIAAMVVVGALTAGGVGIAATGGIQAVKEYLMVELVNAESNKRVYFYVQGEELHDVNGNAVGEFQITDAEGKPVNVAVPSKTD